MHKRKNISSLSRDKDHRKALFRNLISALVLYGRIKTTETKAKAIKALADKIVNRAKSRHRQTKDWLAHYITSTKALAKLYEDLAVRFKQKDSGLTRIIKIGRRRGDNAQMVLVEWIGEEVKSAKLRVQSRNKQNGATSESGSKKIDNKTKESKVIKNKN